MQSIFFQVNKKRKDNHIQGLQSDPMKKQGK